MRRHLITDTTSLASGVLMLVMVVGVLNIEPFESDGASGYNDHRVLYRTELVFNPGSSSQSPVLFSKDVSGDDDAENHISSSHLRQTFFGTALVLVQNPGEVNTRPFYSFRQHTRSSNIPHQNSDEDDAFILPVDVA